MGAPPAKVRPGLPRPLGATWDGAGVNFAVYSEHATAIELCLFEPGEASREIERIPVAERTDHVWHVYVPGARPGLRYGYRAHGAWDPGAGQCFNAAKLLLDPYAPAIAGTMAPSEAVLGHKADAPESEFPIDDRDDAADVPKSVVVDPAFDWGGDRHPRTPWSSTVIYEVHVKGFTARHPDVPLHQRGTYAGFASPPAVAYLKSLGFTAVELLPVHHAGTEPAIAERGLTNYWGYNSIGFFAPDARFSSAGADGGQVTEFKSMVKTLHRAGIEVILDVVYNHTAEGG